MQIPRLYTRIILGVLLGLLVLLNAMAFFHARRFTHFSTRASHKTSEQVTGLQKLKAVLTGVDNPRPQNTLKPQQPFETVVLQSNRQIECWFIHSSGSKGTVALFHGYGGSKSQLLGQAEVFRQLGYHTLLADFMGSGGSEGNQTTVGYLEAEQVRTCYQYLKQRSTQPVHLFGTSMGAVAILKAIADHGLQPASIIIECPFGSMYQTTVARFRMQNLPPFPMAGLLVFWGGLQNGFQPFGHRPADYAKQVSCPTLLLYGELDPKVSLRETRQIFASLAGPKLLKIYPRTGHENYLARNPDQWIADVSAFLEETGSQAQDLKPEPAAETETALLSGPQTAASG